MKYTAVIDRTANNFEAYMPDLSECVATAGSREEVLKEVREAIEFHIEDMRKGGEHIAEPQTSAAEVDAAARAAG